MEKKHAAENVMAIVSCMTMTETTKGFSLHASMSLYLSRTLLLTIVKMLHKLTMFCKSS
jgi:hypothetical protein